MVNGEQQMKGVNREREGQQEKLQTMDDAVSNELVLSNNCQMSGQLIICGI